MSLVLCRRIESQQPANRKLAAADVESQSIESLTSVQSPNRMTEKCGI